MIERQGSLSTTAPATAALSVLPGTMKKFVLVDHSLKDLGGHYYTYASCVLPAAERSGFEAVLATHHDFKELAALPASWRAHAIFRRKSYSQRTLEAGASDRGLNRLWNRLRRSWRNRERARVAQDFAQDCAALFEHVRLSAGDHVFLATASEVDLEGLALFLQSRPQLRVVHWHLQFHLGIYTGRDPDYARQRTSRQMMREVFRSALSRIPEHRLHLYCTTEQLTAQYCSLDAAPFATLPYPVHPLFQKQSFRERTDEPARIACLGHSRREKGYKELPIVVRKLWREYLSNGRAQLVMQTRRRDLRRALDATVEELGGGRPRAPVVYAQFPLALEQYADLVRSTDVGLLLYDSARYYARCSGVLLEMLAAGVPVIVPAGCWLSAQIAEENQQHLERLFGQSARASILRGAELPWRSMDAVNSRRDPDARGAITFDHAPLFAELAAPRGAAALLLRFDWLAPASAGAYVLFTLRQFCADGSAASPYSVVAEQRAGDRPVYAMFHLASGVERIHLACRNAWAESAMTLGDFECLFITGERQPAGAVGLTAANMDQSAELLDDILRHLDHYRAHTAEFARRCAQHHSADQIIAQLTSVANAGPSLDVFANDGARRAGDSG
jgi:glycosyltransferase involved in cell wall biosynthesis